MPTRVPRAQLPVTSPVDPAGRYWSAGIGVIMRLRLAWVGELLPARAERVLEVGCGSGVFLDELSHRSRLTVGIDVHRHMGAVRLRLAGDGVPAHVARADGMQLPFAVGAFDAVVLVSVLEFVPDPEAALREALRVTRTGGRVVFITPRELKWADRVYRFLVGFDPESEFRGGRGRVQQLLARQAWSARRSSRPSWLPSGLAPYEVVVLEA